MPNASLVGMSPARLDRIHPVMESYVAEQGFAGLSVLTKENPPKSTLHKTEDMEFTREAIAHLEWFIFRNTLFKRHAWKHLPSEEPRELAVIPKTFPGENRRCRIA